VEATNMKKLTIFAALCSLTLFTAGCDNSPAAKQGKADKEAVKAEGDALKADINEDAKDETKAVDEAVKETDKEIDSETKAEEGK
jgi:outer membrane murein-binding lipoprotein Lpp